MNLVLSFGKNSASCREDQKFTVAKRMVETFAPLTPIRFPVHRVGLRVPQASAPSAVCTSEQNWCSAAPGRVLGQDIEVVVLAPRSDCTIQVLTRESLEGSCNSIPVIDSASTRKLGDVVVDVNRPPTLSELDDLIMEQTGATPQKIWFRTNESELIPIEGAADIAAFCADVTAFRATIEVVVAVACQARAAALPQQPPALVATLPQIMAQRGPQQAQPSASALNPKTATKCSKPSVGAQQQQTPQSEAEFASITIELNPPVITLVGDIELSELTKMSEEILDKCIGARASLYKKRPVFEAVGTVMGQPAYRLELMRASFDEVHEMQLMLVCLDTMEHFEQYRVVPMDGLVDVQKTVHQAANERNRTALTLGSTKPEPLLKAGVPAKRRVEFFFIAKSH
jgi:hypothetical protein